MSPVPRCARSRPNMEYLVTSSSRFDDILFRLPPAAFALLLSNYSRVTLQL